MTTQVEPGTEHTDRARARSPKLIRGFRLKTRLAVACAFFLAIGALLSPRNHSEPAPSEEKAAPMLQAEAERREPARVFRALQETGRRVAEYSVALPAPVTAEAPSFADFARPPNDLRQKGGFGIAVSRESVLTHVGALAGQSQPALRFADGSVSESHVAGYEADTGLALLRVRGHADLAAAGITVDPPIPGGLAVAAARADGGDLIAPVFVASQGPEPHAITLSSALLVPGTPIFDLAGKAMAIAAGSPAVALAYPIGDALARLERLAAAGRGLPSSIGVFLQAVTPPLARIFGEGGVLVSDVADSSPAASAGLLPGDVILRISGAEVDSVPGALARIAALPAGVSTPVVVRRKARESPRDVVPRVMIDSHLSLPPIASPPDAPFASSALPAATLAALGAPDDALLLAIQNVPVNARTLSAALRRAKPPVLFRFQHGSRRFFAALETAP